MGNETYLVQVIDTLQQIITNECKNKHVHNCSFFGISHNHNSVSNIENKTIVKDIPLYVICHIGTLGNGKQNFHDFNSKKVENLFRK